MICITALALHWNWNWAQWSAAVHDYYYMAKPRMSKVSWKSQQGDSVGNPGGVGLLDSSKEVIISYLCWKPRQRWHWKLDSFRLRGMEGDSDVDWVLICHSEGENTTLFQWVVQSSELAQSGDRVLNKKVTGEEDLKQWDNRERDWNSSPFTQFKNLRFFQRDPRMSLTILWRENKSHY